MRLIDQGQGNNMMASSWMADSLREHVTDLNATNDISLEAAEGYSIRIELLYRELLATELEQGQLVDGQLEVLTNLAKAYETMNQLVGNMVAKRVASFMHLLPSVARLEGRLLKFLSTNFGVLSTSGSL